MKKAFTLIELLAVVAVVAVLCAIALANAQDAMVRSKVARARSDLMALSTALAGYRTDHTEYPPATSFCAPRMESRFDYYRAPPALSSPVAYISSLPPDVFNTPLWYKYVAPGPGIANGSPGTIIIWVPEDYPSQRGRMIAYRSQATSPVQYGLWSVGPAGPLEPLDSDWRYIPVRSASWYDPSNGTRSDGVIVRLSSGETSP